MSFQDPIEQNGAIVIDDLHSPGYVAGVTGWSIKKDGTAEFGQSVIRGSLSVTGPNNTKVEIFVNGLFALIQWTDATGKQFFAYTPQPDDFVIGQQTANRSRLHFTNDTTDATAYGIWFHSDTANRQVCFDENSGYLFVASVFTRLTWINLALKATYTAVAGQTPQYKILPDGRVIMRGIANTNGAAVPAGTVVATLPAGYRPPIDMYAETIYDGSATRGRAIIRAATGNIELYEAPNQFPVFVMMTFSTI